MVRSFITAIAVVGLGSWLLPGGCAPPADVGGNGGADEARLTRFAGGFDSPVAFVELPGEPRRFLVGDRSGRILLLSADGELEGVFLDLREQLVPLNPLYDERGLLGLALHPDYADNGRFFVGYTAPPAAEDAGDFDSRLRVSEFLVSGKTQGDPRSEVVLFELLQPQSNHNGGQLIFGPDGMLYLSVGDGGGAHDTGSGHTPGLGNGQDAGNLYGSILRLDASVRGSLSVPPDNPFVGEEPRDEVYAYGLRNPWRCSFDRGGNQRLFCGDVGQNLYEEVNVITAGGNYGWNLREGPLCFDPGSPTAPPADCPQVDAEGIALVSPVIAYPHETSDGPSGIAVIGGYVYRGTALSGWTGRYVFGDWSVGGPTPGGVLLLAAEQKDGSWTVREPELTGLSGGRLGLYLLGFGQDARGELYVLTSRQGGPAGETGEIWRIDPP